MTKSKQKANLAALNIPPSGFVISCLVIMSILNKGISHLSVIFKRFVAQEIIEKRYCRNSFIEMKCLIDKIDIYITQKSIFIDYSL